jgi:hypothetical protein
MEDDCVIGRHDVPSAQFNFMLQLARAPARVSDEHVKRVGFWARGERLLQ